MKRKALLAGAKMASTEQGPLVAKRRTLAQLETELAQAKAELAERTTELAARNSKFGEGIEHQSATIDVLKTMSASPGDPQPVFDLIVRRAQDLCNAAAASLFEFDGQLVHFRSIVRDGSYGTPDTVKAYERLFPMVPTRDSISCRAILDRQTIHVRDMVSEPGVGATIRNLGYKSQIALPLLRDGTAIGTISINAGEPGGFTDSQVALLQTFAEQAVIAITSAETWRELQARTRDLEESLEYQTATSDVLNVISRSTADVQPVLDTVVETAARLCGADSASLTIREGEVYRFVSASALDADHWASLRQRTVVPGRQSITGRVALEGRVVQIPDLRADPDFALSESVVAGRRTVLGVPLLREGEVLGTINLARKRVEPYTERQIELVRTFADQAVIAMENARLLGELQARTAELAERNTAFAERIDHQAATIDVLKEMSASPADAQPVFDLICDQARALIGTPTVSLFEYDGTLVHLRVRSSSESFGDAVARAVYDAGWPRVPDRGSLSCRAILDGTILHVRDTDAEPGVSPEVRALGHKTQISIPLVRDGRAIGVITTGSQRVDGVSDTQIELLKTFAEQAVIAIQSAETWRELQALTRDLQESLEYQTATSDVLQVISRSTFDLQPVLDTLVETAARLCDADMALIYRRERDAYRLAANRGFPSAYEEFARQLSLSPSRASVTQRAALECRVSHVADITADLEYALPEAASIGGARTALGVPLLREGEPIGVFTLARQRVEPFTERQIELVRTFADQAVIAMENARLLGELQARTHELEESLEYQTATSDVLKVVSQSDADLTHVLQSALDTAARLCDAGWGHIFLRRGDHLTTMASLGVTAENRADMDANPVVVDAHSASGRAVLTGQVVQIADIAADPGYAHASTRSAGIRTMLGVPLLRDGVPIGSMSLARKVVEPFTDKQIELVRTFADQAVIAIANARLLGELRERTRDLEESLEYQTATSNVLNVISRSTADVQPVLDTVAETAARLCSADQGTILIRQGEAYRYMASSRAKTEPGDWALTRQRTVYPGRDSIAGRVALEGKVVHVEDRAIDPDYALPEVVAYGRRTGLGVPLLRDNQAIGIIMLSRNRVEPFTERQIELIRTFADQAVIAIENARLLDEIRQRQAELRVTFDNMGDGVVMFDAKLHLAAWNKNFQELLDLSDDFFAEPHDFDSYISYLTARGEFGTEADPEAELTRLRRRFADHYSFERVRPDGRTVEVRHNPMPDGGFVLIYSDITERKRSEEEIRAARDAAEAAYRDLQATQASLVQAQKMAALGQLTAGIAHEIKNPLNFVNNFASLSSELLGELKEEVAPALAPLDAGQRDGIDETIEMLTGNLDKIVEHGQRADNIVKSMLEHSRGVSGERRAVDLNALVEESLNLAYHGARAQNAGFTITLERDYGPALAEIELAPQEMTRVFLNLFGNGFYAADKRAKASGGNGYRPTLSVTTRAAEAAVEVRVRDNGTGIPAEIRDKLFQPFFTTKPTGEGTGLGLSISYDIVTQQHGGTIEVASEEGSYTEFTIRLPRH